MENSQGAIEDLLSADSSRPILNEVPTKLHKLLGRLYNNRWKWFYWCIAIAMVICVSDRWIEDKLQNTLQWSVAIFFFVLGNLGFLVKYFSKGVRNWCLK